MLLLDENISYKAITGLDKIYPGVTHIRMQGLISESDKKVWDFALANSLCIVSFDNDFEILYQQYGFPPKVIHVAKGNISTIEFIKIMETSQVQIQEFIDTSETGFLKIL